MTHKKSCMINGVAPGNPLGLPTDDEMRAFMRKRCPNDVFDESVQFTPADRAVILLEMSRAKWDAEDNRKSCFRFIFGILLAFVVVIVLVAALVTVTLVCLHTFLPPNKAATYVPVVCDACKETIRLPTSKIEHRLQESE